MWSITTGTAVIARSVCARSGSSSGPTKILMYHPYWRIRSIERCSNCGLGAILNMATKLNRTPRMPAACRRASSASVTLSSMIPVAR